MDTSKGDRGKRIFTGLNIDQAAQLVAAVPDSWSWVDGVLEAAPHLSATEMTRGTGLRLSRFWSFPVPTIRKLGGDEEIRLDNTGLFLKRLLPGFIWFDEVGYNGNITLTEAKLFAAHFLKLGYCGNLLFYSGCRNNSCRDNPAWGRLVLKPDVPVLRIEEPALNPYVELEWDGRYGGKPADIEPLARLCRAFKLREHLPEKEY